MTNTDTPTVDDLKAQANRLITAQETLVEPMQFEAWAIGASLVLGKYDEALRTQASEIERLQVALTEIRDSKFCQYEENGHGQYGIGVTDGHRHCANTARDALGTPHE